MNVSLSMAYRDIVDQHRRFVHLHRRAIRAQQKLVLWCHVHRAQCVPSASMHHRPTFVVFSPNQIRHGNLCHCHRPCVYHHAVVHAFRQYRCHRDIIRVILLVAHPAHWAPFNRIYINDKRDHDSLIEPTANLHWDGSISYWTTIVILPIWSYIWLKVIDYIYIYILTISSLIIHHI